tara:strand:- start:62 stop:418 length:357 start_codon:yes stop_codon:yes gene_type:complete
MHSKKEILTELKNHFLQLKEKFKDNKKITITIADEYVRLDYPNKHKSIFLDITFKIVTLDILKITGPGVLINLKGKYQLCYESMNLDCLKRLKDDEFLSKDSLNIDRLLKDVGLLEHS